MNETYYYPYNLRSQAKLWLWNLRDIVIIGIALLISILALAQMKFILPLLMVVTLLIFTLILLGQELMV